MEQIWVEKSCIAAAAVAVAAVAREDKLKTFEVGNWNNMQRSRTSGTCTNFVKKEREKLGD